MLEPFLKTLAEDLELDDLPKKDEGGIYPFPLTSEVTIFMRELDPGISFWGQIGPCPLEKREDLFILLMKGNFLGQGTGGATIALDENEKFLTLSLVLPYDMNYKVFKDALEDFVNFLKYWREELIRHKKSIEESIL